MQADPSGSACFYAMAKHLLIDGFNLAFRAYYALPELTRSDGTPTGALHGWVKAMWKLEDLEQPDAFIVFFDQGGSDRHRALLPDYKANRDEMPAALEVQMPALRELTGLLGYPVVAREGIEADDLIGSAARRLNEAGERVVIVSADKDLAQCVGGGVTQLLPAPTANPRLGWRTLDAEAVRAKFGVGPERVPDYLALIGDSSDNIPGLPGVGPKTAAKWLQAYGDLAGVVAHAGEIKPPRFREILPAAREDLERNLRLVTLETSYEVGDLGRRPVDTPALVNWLEAMEMKQSAAQAYDRYGLGLG